MSIFSVWIYEDLLIIDQHAAHDGLPSSAKNQFQRVVSRKVPFSGGDRTLILKQRLAEHAAAFQKLGFDLEDFGGQTRCSWVFLASS
jgi:DNA mismatch repair ATPase MutL